MALALDAEELERRRLRRHVFLARYGRQSMLQWGDVEGREVRAYVAALAEILKEEEDATRQSAREA